MSLPTRRPLLETENGDNALVVKLIHKNLDESNAQAVAEQLFGMIDGLGQRQLRVDLGEVQLLTSTGLGKLVALHRRVKAAGSELTLHNVNELVYEVFEVTRLNTILNIHRPGKDFGAA
jgi:anti-sigma B factor antagonist